MDYSEWIGTVWEARCDMRLPKGGVSVGDTFTYDDACAALKLDPVSWQAIGNAVRLDAAPALSETVERRSGKRKRDPFVFDTNPLAAAPEPEANDLAARLLYDAVTGAGADAGAASAEGGE